MQVRNVFIKVLILEIKIECLRKLERKNNLLFTVLR